MKHHEAFKEDIHLLLEAGFIAINQADEDSAKKLLKAAALIEPNNILVHIGQGYLAMHKLDAVTAQKHFEHALTMDPDNQMAKAFLGLSYLFIPNGVAKGERMCSDVLQHTKETQLKDFAESALEFSDTFIRQQGKKAGPMSLQKKPARKPRKNN